MPKRKKAAVKKEKKSIPKKLREIKQWEPDNPYLPKPYKVLAFFRESPVNFTLTVDFREKHAPGQFVQVSLPGFGEAPISICSDSEEYLQLNIREVGHVTKQLALLRKGGTIFIRGPYGKGYPMEVLKGNNIVVIGAGCGVAPLRGVVEYIKHHRSDYKEVHLYLGYHSYDDVLFKKEMEMWKSDFTAHVLVSETALPQGVHACYEAEHGHVTDALKAASLDKFNKVVFICGPPPMIKDTIAILKEKGFNDDQIFISAERLMYCALGVCCHCMIRGKFTCIDGPVFRYDEVKNLNND